MSSSDQFPIPVRSAVKSNLTVLTSSDIDDYLGTEAQHISFCRYGSLSMYPTGRGQAHDTRHQVLYIPRPYYRLMWGLWMLSTRSVWDSCLESDGTTESEMMKYYNGPVWLHCPISYHIDASRYLGMWLGLTASHRQTWLFSSTSTYYSTDLLTVGVAHLVVHGTSGSTSYETIPPVRMETSGGVLSTVGMVVQLGLPDLPYFTGDPVFQTLSPASRGEAAGKNKFPVFC